MPGDYTLDIARQALYLVLLVSAPVVIVSVVVGLLVSVLQAATQLQDHTLSFAPKLLAVCLTLAVCGAWMGSLVLAFAKRIFEHIPLWH